MFNKLLTNLPFNPSLIGQVSFYAKRLQQETSIRRLGFLFVALSLVVQIYAFTTPPEASVQASGNDLIAGGFTTQDEAVRDCQNTKKYDFAAILKSAPFHITCDNIAKAHVASIRSNTSKYGQPLYSMGRIQKGFKDEIRVNTEAGVMWMRPLAAWDTGPYSTYKMLVGTTSDGATFMIIFDCGNLVWIGKPVTPPQPCKYDSKLTTTDEKCTQCPYNKSIGITNATCKPPKCPQDSKLTADSPQCKACQYDTTILKSSPSCPRCTYAGLTNIAATSPQCRPNCPYNSSIAANDSRCKPCDAAQQANDINACLVLSKSARNDTKKIDANGSTAQNGNIVTYTLSTKNTGKIAIKQYSVKEDMSDVLEYATITDLHGGHNDIHNIVFWPAADIAPGQTLVENITVKIKDQNTPVSTSDPGSFDRVLTNVYGNTVTIKLPNSIIKTTEIVTTKTIPKTGPGASVAAAIIITVIGGYMLARSRLLAKELMIVKEEYAGGF